MTRHQRKIHLIAWAVLGVLLVVGFAAGLAVAP